MDEQQWFGGRSRGKGGAECRVGAPAILCALMAAMASTALAQVDNGSFDDDVDGWLDENAAIEVFWDARDAGNSANSGSMRIVNVGTGDNGGTPNVGQCVPVSGGTTATVEASLLIPQGQSAPAEAAIFVSFNEAVDCGGTGLGLFNTAGVGSTGGAWQQVSLSELVPSNARSARIGLGLRKPGGGAATVEAFYDDVRLLGPAGGCSADFDELCLNGDSFLVEVSWLDATGNSGRGQALPLTGDSGLFWFFDADNPELLIKVVDGCGINDRFWVFAAGTTDVGFDLDVTHLASGASRRYSNPLGTASDAVTDTGAFAVCP